MLRELAAMVREINLQPNAEEFYGLYLEDFDLNRVNAALGEWEQVYNTIRLHQSLDPRTPAEYLRQHASGLAPTPRLPHMS